MSNGITNQCFPPANNCVNCERKYHDDRPARVGDASREYKRCTGCRLMTYCDQDCQREHWLRIHKQHCRFLEGRKHVKNNEHNPQTCGLCVEKSAEVITSISSPKIACYMESAIKGMKIRVASSFGFHAKGKTCTCPSTFSWPGQLPLLFGEVSGHYFGDGRDEMMSHALKLATAIPIKIENKDVSEETKRILFSLLEGRIANWTHFLIAGKELLSCVAKNESLHLAVNNLKKYLGASNPWCIALRFSIDVLYNIEVQSYSPITVKSDFMEKCQDDPRFSTFIKILKHDSSQYKNIEFASSNNLLSQFKVWPQLQENTLVALLPSGLYCRTCNDKVDGQFSFGEDEDHRIIQYPRWFKSVGENGSCEVYCSLRKNPNCVREGLTKNVRRDIESNKDEWKAYTDELSLLLKLSRICDECGKRSIFSHRCSGCRAAQYCSTECQVEDLDFHKSVCAKWAKDESRTLGSAKEQRKYWKIAETILSVIGLAAVFFKKYFLLCFNF